MSTMMQRPIQKAEKLPATKPDRIFSDAPPCLEQFVTSRTCLQLVLTKTLVNSGISAPATVPQLMMTESTHQRSGCATVESPIVPSAATFIGTAKSPSNSLLAMNVTMMETA